MDHSEFKVSLVYRVPGQLLRETKQNSKQNSTYASIYTVQGKLLLSYIFSYLFCLCVGTHMIIMSRSEDNFLGISSFNHAGSGEQTQVIRL